MATLHINMKAGKHSPSAEYEALTTGAGTAATTAVTDANGGTIELNSTEDHLVSIGVAPNAETDPGRFYMPANFPICIHGVAKGMKVAAITVA